LDRHPDRLRPGRRGPELLTVRRRLRTSRHRARARHFQVGAQPNALAAQGITLPLTYIEAAREAGPLFP